jgi:hypothetical protein
MPLIAFRAYNHTIVFSSSYDVLRLFHMFIYFIFYILYHYVLYQLYKMFTEDLGPISNQLSNYGVLEHTPYI